MLLGIAPYLVVFARFIVDVKVFFELILSRELELLSYNGTCTHILGLRLRQRGEGGKVVTFLLGVVFHFAEDSSPIGV